MQKLTYPFLLVIILFFYTSNSFAQNFDKAIKTFKHQDSLQMPPKKAILFVGSSSFTNWKTVNADFPGYPIINRGFGGSTLSEVKYYANDIIFPYDLKQVVIYCGDNDIRKGDNIPEKVFNRFKELYELIRSRNKKVNITFISIKPSILKKEFMEQTKAANVLIQQFLEKKKYANYIDVFSVMLNPDGSVMENIFRQDGLHMNTAGYAIWIKAIKPYLLK